MIIESGNIKRLVEDSSSQNQARKVTISGVSSAADILGRVLTIKSVANGEGGYVTLTVNNLPAYQIVGAAPGGTTIYADGINTGWVAAGQSYSVVLEEYNSTYRFVAITKNTSQATVGEHGVTQLMTSITSESEVNAATPKSVKLLKDYMDTRTVTKTVSLAASGWSNLTQTITITDIDLTKELDMGLPVPTTRANTDAVVDSELIIESVSQTAVTFSVSQIPTIVMTVVLRGFKK